MRTVGKDSTANKTELRLDLDIGDRSDRADRTDF